MSTSPQPPSSFAITRRRFLHQGTILGTAVASGTAILRAADATPPARRIKVGVIGCGSVSRMDFPNLAACPLVELVAACDIIPERAKQAAEKFAIPHHYPSIQQMLAGAPFELFVNLTDMQEHERLNRQATEAGKHIWSEKPIANSLAAGQDLLKLARGKRVRLWGAPTVVQSPQFAFMARTIAAGTLGRVAAAHASYGHLGPDWAEFFYSKGGGSLPDLGVYNLTFGRDHHRRAGGPANRPACETHFHLQMAGGGVTSPINEDTFWSGRSPSDARIPWGFPLRSSCVSIESGGGEAPRVA